jgi:hypothetical protein
MTKKPSFRKKLIPVNFFTSTSIAYRKHLLRDNAFPILMVIITGSLALGVVGFSQYFNSSNFHAAQKESIGFGTSLYLALGLFKFSSITLYAPLPWTLEVARWLSPIVAASTITIGIYNLLRKQLEWLKMKSLHSHIIICGLSSHGMKIVRELQQKGMDLVVIEQDKNNNNIPECTEMGIPVINGDARNELVLKKAQIDKARILVCLYENDGINIDIAATAQSIVGNRKGKTINCAININNPELWEVFRNQEFVNSTINRFNLSCFNAYNYAAKELISTFSILDSLQNKEKASHKLYLIGCDTFSEHIILNLARKWRLLSNQDNRKLQITIIDPNAELFKKRLCQKYSLVDKSFNFETINSSFSSLDNKDKSIFEFTKPTPIILINLQEEKDGLECALILARELKKIEAQIILLLADNKGLRNIVDKFPENEILKNINIYCPQESSLSDYSIFNTTQEMVAREIHKQYVIQENKKGYTEKDNIALVEWKDLDESLKNMNREQAEEIGEKLSKINCMIIPWFDYDGHKFIFSNEEIEYLAQIEHKRWCDQKIKEGWKYGLLKDAKKKTHPLLIGWDHPALTEEEKEKDRSTIRNIPTYLSDAGYQIVRKYS